MPHKSVEDIINKVLTSQKQPVSSSMAMAEVEPPHEGGNRDGTIAVVSGRVIIKKPLGTGKYPTISPGQGLKVLVDNELVEDIAVLTEDNDLQIVLPDEEPYSEFDILVSGDELEAYLVVNMHYGKKYRLVDQEPTQHLLLKAEIAETIVPRAISMEQVQEKLQSLGIRFGINLEAIKQELKAPSGKRVLIAQGIPPVPSKDGFIEYTFDMVERKLKPVLNNERVDYLDRGQFQTVNVGTVLAIKHPPVLGQAGISVKGHEIPVTEPKDVEIQVGQGVNLVNQGQKAVATSAGRPVAIGKTRTITILTQLKIPGDVDIKTGHIRFEGDVLIGGNVMEGLLVQAKGRVTVMGNVYSARIIAGEDIIINHNIVGSKISAGGSAAFFSRILPILKQLQEELRGVNYAVEQLKSNPMFLMQDLKIQGDANLIKLLIDIKFKKIPKLVDCLGIVAQSVVYELESPVLWLIETLKNKLTGLGPLSIKSTSELDDILIRLVEVIDIGEETVNKIANVVARYAQNSTIEATGSVKIFGEGSYQSNIYSGKEVEIAGVCRGGEVKANGDVAVVNLGSNAAVTTKVETSQNGEIRANRVFPNVFLKVGQQSFKSEYILENVKCFYDRLKGFNVMSNCFDKGGVKNA